MISLEDADVVGYQDFLRDPARVLWLVAERDVVIKVTSGDQVIAVFLSPDTLEILDAAEEAA